MIEWRPVIGFEGFYEVSNEGGVRSVGRTVQISSGRFRTYRARDISPAVASSGYYTVQLSIPERGARTYCVHRLVAEAFYGAHPGMEVRHLDGTRANNHVSNLAWGTHSQNTLDKRHHGTDHNANRADCKRGHRLVPPNLNPSVSRRSGGRWRGCLACSRALSKLRHPPNRHLDMQAVADEYYREIMQSCL
jgi:hypothetical protein